MIKKLKTFLKLKGQDKKVAIHSTLSSKDILFHHWHRILLLYALANVVFIVISLLILSGIGTNAPDSDLSTYVTRREVFTPEKLEGVNKLQHYKNLVNQGVIPLDHVDPF